MPIKIVIDTDIGEDIDDILALAFALRCSEFDVLGITTVDGDTAARARIARKLLSVLGRTHVPVAAGSERPMGNTLGPIEPGTAVTQGDLAPDEDGLPPLCPLRADELLAELAARHPGEVSVLTIGALTNVGQALARFPERFAKIGQVVTNGGSFGEGLPTRIGWNLRYDPVAAALVARSGVPWALLSESTCGPARLGREETERLCASRDPLARLLWQAIELWRAHKKECTPESMPHLSDLDVFAYLLGGWITVRHGCAAITVPPAGQLAELHLGDDPYGPHRLGNPISREAGTNLRAFFMEQVLGQPEPALSA